LQRDLSAIVLVDLSASVLVEVQATRKQLVSPCLIMAA